MNSVGLIGLGLLGSAIADRLVRGQVHVLGFDINECQRHVAAQQGVSIANSTSQVFQQQDVVLLSLPNSDIVETVLEQCRLALPGKLIIDTTTGDPDQTATRGERLRSLGTQYLDATVVGSSHLVRNGEGVLLVGGEQDSFQQCEALFKVFVSRWFYLGPWGSGARMKLVVNLVLGLNRAVLAEGLSYAAKSGFDPSTTLDILRSGAAYSRIMDLKGQKMITGDFAPEARLSQHLKDVRLILKTSEQVGAHVPLSELHMALLSQLENQGYGDQDNSVIIRAFDALGGA